MMRIQRVSSAVVAKLFIFVGLQLMFANAVAQLPPYDVFPDAHPPYYRIRYVASTVAGELSFPVNYTIWIPPDVARVRGIVVHQHGCGEGSCKSGLTGAFDLHWQALARKHDCALLAPAYEQPQAADCQLWCDPRNGSAKAFQQCLRDLGKASGHEELSEVPWALWGHSGGGHWVGGMALMFPEKVIAAWLRSGVPLLTEDPTQPNIRAHEVTQAVLQVPIACNFGTKEGYTVKNADFAGVWPSNEKFFMALRTQGGLIGLAIDPRSSHECGNQRYLAIVWLDACMQLRVPRDASNKLLSAENQDTWLGLHDSIEIYTSRDFNDKLKASWLPNQAVAQAWKQYSLESEVNDLTAPPAPSHIRINGNKLTWEAQADLESGIAKFLIYRDGQIIASLPENGNNKHGRSVFQGLTYSDTPSPPLATMTFEIGDTEASSKHEYRVVSINTVGIRSDVNPAR